MNLIRIWDIYNNEVDISAYGLLGLRLIIPSPSYEVTRENVPGRPGTINVGKYLSPREISAEFLVESRDYADSLLLRDELFNLFSKGNEFYVGEQKQPGKRWYVESTEQWTPDRINPSTFITTIPMNAEKGLAESVGTTLDPFTFDSDLWQIGQGLIAEDLIYTHNTTSFQIFNAGDVEIDPRYFPLKISYKGASTDLKIKNVTTGEEWAHTGTSNAEDTILLDGIRSTKNELSVFRNTNKKLITLKPGWNDFELTGTNGSFEIIFDFRFYYL